jgi:hypothetical protein
MDDLPLDGNPLPLPLPPHDDEIDQAEELVERFVQNQNQEQDQNQDQDQEGWQDEEG